MSSQIGHAVLPKHRLATNFSGAVSAWDSRGLIDLAEFTDNIDTVIRAKAFGVDANAISVRLIADLVDGIAASTILTAASNAARANAFNTLTFASNPLDTETVTIEGVVYTFLAILVDAPGNVLIGADAEESLANLEAAVTGGAGAGTLYGTGTTEHADVTAAPGAGDTMVATAKAPGTGGNALTATTTVTGAGWTAGTFAGGAAAGTVVLGATTYSIVDYLAAANDVLRGATASDTLDNLDAAIDAGAGEGTVYGTGTTANAQVTAAAGAGDTLDITADAEGAAGNSIASTTTVTGWSFTGTTLAGGIDGGTNTLTDDEEELTVVIHIAPNDTTVAELETLIATSELIEVGTAGTAGNVVVADDAFGPITFGDDEDGVTPGTAAGKAIPDYGRTDRGYLIVSRGASADGAVTVANARLHGRIEDEDDEDFVRFAELGTLSLAAGEDSRAILVTGVGAWKRLAFDCDAIVTDNINVDFLFLNQHQA